MEDSVARGSGTHYALPSPESTFDPRGLFVAVMSALLLGACFLPYYRVLLTVGTGSITAEYKVVDNLYGSWREVLPAIAALCILIGLVNTALRVNRKGAVTAYFTLRVVAVAQLGLWIFVFVDRTSKARVPLDATVHTTVTWVGYAAIAVAAIALAATFAIIKKPAD